MGNTAVVWVFNGGGAFPSGVFTDLEIAEAWISANRLTGILTAYPLDIGVYDWAVGGGYFTPKRDDQKSPEFIGRFSSGALEHYHYEDGVSRRPVTPTTDESRLTTDVAHAIE
jgi:hypothetical protein